MSMPAKPGDTDRDPDRLAAAVEALAENVSWGLRLEGTRGDHEGATIPDVLAELAHRVHQGSGMIQTAFLDYEKNTSATDALKHIGDALHRIANVLERGMDS